MSTLQVHDMDDNVYHFLKTRMDLLIASTALYMNYSLVTNNQSHFRRIDDLVLENWERKLPQPSIT